ncbi:murein hydrolase activator EnvC family protein [Deinococcus hopiensis]|uniref:murein hydrolase activator EnvC family protein n=1 Tax=Deinococcus hopiensis TaxID=309885 RepID=UPI001FE51772|nr:M23 family metallopeptidase [Deinococcus hopiensis]
MTLRRKLLLSAALLTGTGEGWAQIPAASTAQKAPQKAAASNGGPLTSARLKALQRQLQEQRQQVRQQRQDLERLQKNIKNLSSQQRQTLARLNTLSTSVADLENETATLAERVQLAQAQLEGTSAQRRVTQVRVNRLQGDLRQLLSALYRERSGRYLQLLSQSRSLSDLLIRLKYVNRAGQYNVEVTRTLRSEVQTLTRQRTQQAQETANLEALQRERLDKLTELRDRRAEQTRLLSGLRRSEQGQRVLAAQNQAQQALTARTISGLVGAAVQERAQLEEERRRRLEEERRRREAELRRIREAQERARQEALRQARVRAEQERQARIRAEQARIQAERERRAQLERERRARALAEAQAREAALRQAQAQAAREQAAREREQAERDAALAAQQRRAAQLQQEREALAQREAQVQQAQEQTVRELAPLPASSGPLAFPLPGGRITQPYGEGGAQWIVVEGGDGAQAVAALAGNVIATTNYASLGWVVLVDHGPAVTAYFGLADTRVGVGDRVDQGAPLGTVGGSPIFGPGRMAFQLNEVSGGSRQPVAPPF